MANRNLSSIDEDYSGRRQYRNISWGLIAGAFIALAVEAVLALLGQFIGFSVINSPLGGVPVVGYGASATVWWVVTFIVALFVGGWFAGRLAGIPNRAVGSWNGLASWGFAMLVLLAFLATPLGTAVGGSFNVLNRAAYTSAGTATASLGAAGYGAAASSRAVAAAARNAVPVKSEPGAQRAAVAAFVMMLFGAIAAAAGGAAGAPREVRPYAPEGAAAYERPTVEEPRATETTVTR